MNEIQLYETKINQTISVAEQIMSMPKYNRMKKEEVLAVLQTANSLGIDPFLALNKDLYPVNGKVEMSAELMNRLIRQAGHSIHVKQLDNNICVLAGKRRDTGEVMEASFSIEDAKLAGIYRNSWHKFPQDMLWARALSRIGRRLFPDVLCGCYIQGEISDPPGENSNGSKIHKLSDEMEGASDRENTANEDTHTIDCKVKPCVNPQQVATLAALLKPHEDVYKQVMWTLEKEYNIESLADLDPKMYDNVKTYVLNQIKLKNPN